jgi:hypothetical protein
MINRHQMAASLGVSALSRALLGAACSLLCIEMRRWITAGEGRGIDIGRGRRDD